MTRVMSGWNPIYCSMGLSLFSIFIHFSFVAKAESLPEVHCINGKAIILDQYEGSYELSADEVNMWSTDEEGIDQMLLDFHQPFLKKPSNRAKEVLIFDESKLGKNKIDLWVSDHLGNWARMSTYILVSKSARKINARTEEKVINYPNPFFDQTEIQFFLKKPSKVSISIIDERGKEILKYQKEYPKGTHKYKIKRDDLQQSGKYYYQIQTDTYLITKNMIMVNN